MTSNLTIEEKDAIIGYKGMKKTADGKFMCRDMEYKLNETYVLNADPKICSTGFHFCRQLDQTFEFYGPENADHVYFKVKGWGKVSEQTTKLAVDRLKVIEQVSKDELEIILLKPQLEKVDKILEDNPNVVISGSLALILMGLMPYRTIKDVDMTVPYFGGFNKALVEGRFGDSGEDCIKMSLSGLSFDLFVNPSSTYSIVEFNGKKYKVSDFKPIVDAKYRYLMKGNTKHIPDLIHVFSTLRLKMLSENPRDVVNSPDALSTKIFEVKELKRMEKTKAPTLPINDDFFEVFKDL